MTCRRSTRVVTLILVLLALAASPAAAQTVSPMTRWLIKLSSIRQELETVKIPAYYCKPPKTPQKPPDLGKLRKIGLDLAEAENELRAIESAFRNELPHGQRLEGDDPRIKNYPPIGRTTITTEDTTGSAGKPYFAAAWRVFHDAKTVHSVKLKRVESMDPVTCVDPSPDGQPPPDDPIGFLKPPRYYPITPPPAAACYESSEAKRGPYNRAFEEEQEANTNINMADAYVQAIRDLQVHYANTSGPADIRARLATLMTNAETDRNARRADYQAAYARLQEIVAAPIPCPNATPAGQPPRPRTTTTVLGGPGFETGTRGPVLPPPAGSSQPAPGNRTYTPVPTWLIEPGIAVLGEVMDLLDEADFADFYGLFDLADDLEWQAFGLYVGARLSQAISDASARRLVRVYTEGLWSSLPSPSVTGAELNSRAELVQRAIRNGLLRANPTSFATLATAEEGGYLGGLRLGGGVEVEVGSSVWGFRPSVRTGLAVTVPVGSPKVHTFDLNYGFAASGVNFAQTDHATLSFSRGTSVGIDGGVTLSRRLAGRSELVLDVLVSAQQSTSKATLSTNPTTTSTQPGAIVFSTPSGTRTIVISTTPGVTSSLSQPVSDHPVVTAKGWSVGPAVRIGITF